VTQHGDVDVFVDSDIEADFDLRGADVNMSRSLRLNGRVDDDRVEGSVNGGGRTIKARTTRGSVAVRSN